MKLLISTLILLLSTVGHASWDECQSEVSQLITHPVDQFILRENKALIEKYGYANCQDLPASLNVAIHEAVHFLDLNTAATPAILKPDFDFDSIFQGLFIEPNRRTAKSKIVLESPHSVIKRYTLRKPEKWDAGSKELKRKYDLYIASPGRAASGSLLIGAASELNAYTHGLAAMQRMAINSGKINLGIYGERNGLLAFLIFFHIYIDQIHFENDLNWKTLSKDAAAKSIISELTSEAINAIASSNVCKTTHPQIDGPVLADVQLYFNRETFKEVVGPELSSRLVDELTCSSH
jgi:hypothetical protein